MNKHGFLLVDSLVCIFITIMIVTLLFTLTTSRTHTKEILQDTITNLQESIYDTYLRIPIWQEKETE